MRALLEAVDLVLDVLGVRVDGRRDDLGEVVGEEIGRVEARVPMLCVLRLDYGC